MYLVSLKTTVYDGYLVSLKTIGMMDTDTHSTAYSSSDLHQL